MVYSLPLKQMQMRGFLKMTSVHFTTILFSLLTIVVPVYADMAPTTEPSGQQAQQKNECLLAAKNCGRSIMSVQDKIALLKDEISKGRDVYMLEELNNLRQKLDDVSRTLDFLLEK